MNSVGKRIKKMRSDMGMSQVDFASAIGVSKQTLYKYENDLITNIPSDKIEAAAKIGNVTPAVLMGWTDEKSVADPAPVTPIGSFISSDEAYLLKIYRQLNTENKSKVAKYADALLLTQEGDEVVKRIVDASEREAAM